MVVRDPDFIYRIYWKCLKTRIVVPCVGTYYLLIQYSFLAYSKFTPKGSLEEKFLEDPIGKPVSHAAAIDHTVINANTFAIVAHAPPRLRQESMPTEVLVLFLWEVSYFIQEE